MARDAAATSASNAAGSASSAAASQSLTAATFQKAAELYGNGNFDFGLAGWEGGISALTPISSFDGRSNTVRSTAGTNPVIYGPRVSVTSFDQRFRLRASWRCSGGPNPMVFYAGLVFYGADGTQLAASDGTGNYPLSLGEQLSSGQGWRDREAIVGGNYTAGSPYGGTTSFPAGTTTIRPIFIFNHTSLAAPSDLDYFTVTDVTSELASAASASASSSSASAAAASKTGADAAASAASGYRDAAQVQAGNASSSASSAAGSAASASSSASAAASSQSLSAAYSATRGMTPNGDFSRGAANWTLASMYAASLNGYGDYVATNTGVAGQAYQADTTAVDPARRYRLHCNFVVHAANAVMYAGLSCFTAAGASLGDIYMDTVIGQNFPHSTFYTKVSDYAGINAGMTNPPYYTGGGQFPVGTARVQALVLANYTANAGSYVFVQDLYLEDVTESYNAGLQAAAAASSSAAASASAAQAQSSYVLSASLAIGSLNKNGNFTGTPTSGNYVLPPNWNVWTNPPAYGWRHYAAGGVSGPDAYLDYAEIADYSSGIYQDIPSTGGSFVASATIQCVDGNLSCAGLLIHGLDANGTYVTQALVDFSADPDINGQVYTGGAVGDSNKVIRFSKLITLNGSNIRIVRIHNMTMWRGGSFSIDANSYRFIKWHSSGIRPASSIERTAGTAIPSLNASVSTLQSAVATIDGRTQAYWAVSANAGGTSASIEARATTNPDGSTSSKVGVVAEEFSVTNTAGGVRRRVLSVLGRDVIIDGNLTASSGVFLGSGAKWAYQLKTKTFSVSDGQTVSFGLDLGAVPTVDFSSIGLAPLAAGETYRLYADSLTATGFVARLRIVTPGTASSYNVSNSTAPGSGPTRQLARGEGNPEANGGNYTLTVGGTYTGYAYYDQYVVSGYVQVGIWRKVGGVWSMFTTEGVYIYQDVGNSPGRRTVNWSLQNTYTLGAGVTDFGATIQSTDDTAAVNYLAAAWSASSASGERTASPGGEQAAAVVRP